MRILRDYKRPNQNIDWYADIMEVTAKDIIERFGRPDVIWASPPCTSYSIAAISHHRKKNVETGSLDPVSDFAKLSDELVKHTLELIKELKPKYWFIENPRGGMRKMDFMQGLPRYTVTYCQYGDTRMKPTDIWTNHPNPQFKPMCHNGDPCHEKAPLLPKKKQKDYEYFFSEEYTHDNGYFNDWEEFFDDWENEHEEYGDVRPKYVWVTEPVEMSINAESIAEQATEDLYEDAYDDISDGEIKRLQEILDHWAKTCGVSTTYYESHKYKVRIPWEDYNKRKGKE